MSLGEERLQFGAKLAREGVLVYEGLTVRTAVGDDSELEAGIYGCLLTSKWDRD